jgi:ABC-type branched-subunit amino acid transport system ATPase component
LIDEITEGLQPSVIAQIAAVLRRERDAGTAMLLN